MKRLWTLLGAFWTSGLYRKEKLKTTAWNLFLRQKKRKKKSITKQGGKRKKKKYRKTREVTDRGAQVVLSTWLRRSVLSTREYERSTFWVWTYTLMEMAQVTPGKWNVFHNLNKDKRTEMQSGVTWSRLPKCYLWLLEWMLFQIATHVNFFFAKSIHCHVLFRPQCF